MFSGWIERVRSVQAEEFWIVITALSIGAVVSFALIWRNLRRAHIIENTPTARIRSAPQGYVELEGDGRLLPGTPIVAPLTGRPCLWYSYRIEEKRTVSDSRGRSYTTWVTLRSETSDGLFVISDNTGVCIIDPDGAEVAPSVRDVWYGDRPWPSGIRQSRLFGGDYRYTEKRLHEGYLYAIGQFSTVNGNDASLKEKTLDLLRQWKADQPALLRRFDADGDGRIDAHEWETARGHAARQTLAEQTASRSPLPPNLLSRPSDSHYPFLISADGQWQLARRYRRRSAFALIGLAVSATACAALLAMRLTG